MRMHSRIRCVAKWIGLVCCVSIAGIFAASNRLGWVWWPDGRRWIAYFNPGHFELMSDDFLDHISPIAPDWPPIVPPAPAVPSWRWSVRLWLPLVLSAVCTAWLWLGDRDRPVPGHCCCGYDLTGNVSGRCPECG